MDLNGKVAIVTGGARGLGKGITEALLERGTMVVIADISTSVGLDAAQSFNKTYGQGRVMFMQCDVSLEEDINRVFKNTKAQYDHIDMVVNNAGLGNEERLKELINVNLLGVIMSTRLALQYMNKANGGRGGLIVNIGSIGGLTPVPFEPAYAATKYGVVGYTRSIALRPFDTTDQNIRVACLCPSFFRSTMKGTVSDHPGGRKIYEDTVLSVGRMEASRVVEAFLNIVEHPNNNGGIYAVSPKSMRYVLPQELEGKL